MSPNNYNPYSLDTLASEVVKWVVKDYHEQLLGKSELLAMLVDDQELFTLFVRCALAPVISKTSKRHKINLKQSH